MRNLAEFTPADASFFWLCIADAFDRYEDAGCPFGRTIQGLIQWLALDEEDSTSDEEPDSYRCQEPC